MKFIKFSKIPFILVTLAAVTAVAAWFVFRDSEPVSQVGDGVKLVEIPKPNPGKYDGTPRREVPKFTPSSEIPILSDQPSDIEIANSRLFRSNLLAIDVPGENADDKARDNAEVAKLFQELQDVLPRLIAILGAEGELLEKRLRKERFEKIENWLKKNPDSRWAKALQNEVLAYQFDRGYFKQAREGWQGLWDELKTQPSGGNAHEIANQAVGRLFDTNRSFARTDKLRQLIAETEGRNLGAPLEGKRFLASEALWLLEHTGAQNVMCGPLALNCINHSLDKPINTPLLSKVSPEYIKVGLPLTEVAAYAEANYKLKAHMARRTDPVASIPTPAVMHMSDEHYIAVLQTNEAGDEYFIEDRTLRFSGWVDRRALDEMASGYFLLAENDIPASGWAAVLEAEGRQVFGRDGAHGTDEDLTDCGPQTNCACPKGMPGYSMHLIPASLRIGDIPLGYKPPIGPEVNFKINFVDLDEGAPISDPAFSNLGIGWSTDWVAWIDHQPGAFTANSSISVRGPGGGTASHKFNSDLSPNLNGSSNSKVERTGAYTYTRYFADGSKEIYNTPDVPVAPTRVFLTQRVDPQGNALIFSYDSQLRLVSVTDAIGQVTTLQYVHPSDSHKITSVTDPFNRTAVIGYDSNDRIISITDQINLTSTFSHTETGYVESMTTPYGTTTFEKGGAFTSASKGGNYDANTNWLQATDPNGDIERVEYVDNQSGPNIASTNTPPEWIKVSDRWVSSYGQETGMKFRNTFHWSKEAWHKAPGDYTAAVNYHWYTDINWVTAPVLQAVKKPMEDRVWYDYPGSSISGWNVDRMKGSQATGVLRMKDDGTPELTQFKYNAKGKPTRTIDAEGRSTDLIYAANGLDVIEVRQTTGGIKKTLGTATYNANNQLLVMTNVEGKTSTFSYNANGQVASFSDSANRDVSMNYDTNGYLMSMDGPLAGNTDTTSFTYDAYGRVNSITDEEGYTISMVNDNFDRVTQANYPDGTSTQNTYDRLNLASTTDRLGRTTSYTHNSLGQITTATDPLDRVTSYDWCRCGALKKLTDALGQITQWEYDLQDRLEKKIYPDGSEESWSYDPGVGRLISYVARNGQSQTYDYFIDGQLKSITYPIVAGIPATIGVSFTYGAVFGRVATMIDGIGTTTYTYHPIGAPGSGRLASEDGPWENDTVTYTYDQQGRVAGQQIDGVDFGSNRTYDTLDRLKRMSNALGNFSYAYQGNSSRMINTNYPNGMVSNFAYESAIGDFRLNEIDNQLSGGASLSKFSYTHNTVDLIQTWTREFQGSPSTAFTFSYDAANQLTSALLQQGGTPLKQYTYGYDVADNRTSKQYGIFSETGTHNNLNQVTSLTAPNRPTRFFGTLDEVAAGVTVDGKVASMGTGNSFEAFLDLPLGPNTVTIQATDKSQNVTSKDYQLTVSAPVPDAFTYDVAGNLTRHEVNGKARLYEWDAANRLLAIQSDENPIAGDWRTEFAYNGINKRVKRTEFSHDGNNWVQIEAVTYLWCGTKLCQERDATGATVVEHFFAQGFARPNVEDGSVLDKWLVTRDHLSSVREVVAWDGALDTRYDYTPFGEVETLTAAASAVGSKFRYTGHFYHERSGLHLAQYRVYDAKMGRWLSADPIKEDGGLNLYAYVGNDPVNYIDPLGLLDVYIWDFTGIGEGEAWGHASISLEDGTHISWWPGSDRTNKKGGEQKGDIYEADPNDNQTLLRDIELEYNRQPDHKIHLDGLDEAAIKKWWLKFKNKNKWKTLSKNCSTITYKALREGGGPVRTPKIWTPKSAKNYANQIKAKSGN